MRKTFIIFSVCLLAMTLASRADTVTLTDGTSLTGDLLRSDGTGLMLRTPDNVYTNLPWARFSQDSLKQLSQNPKIAPFVEPFIEPTESQRPAAAEITLNPVKRLEKPANPSLIGGLLKSSVGLFVLLVLYVANLLAAYEVSLVRARTPAQVMGMSAIFPVIAPVVFLWLPIKAIASAEDAPMEAVTAPSGTGQNPEEEILIVEVTRKAEEKKPEPQIFTRGRFTFNKRFVETKFAGFIGEAQGDAKNFTMEVKTTKAQFAVERIMQVSPAEVIFETTQPGQVTVLLADIQEIKLIPKTA